MNEQAPGTAQGSSDSIKKEKIEEDIIKMILENQDNNKTTGLGEVGSRLVSLHPILMCEATAIICCQNFRRV